MEQVKCKVQLQRCSTISQACRIEQITVELVPNSPVGVSPFLFCPPDGLAAVAYRDTPPAIAWPSLLRSEIAAGLLHRELTPLTHSRRPLARQRPHLHYTVAYVGGCVYIYMCVCVCDPVFPEFSRGGDQYRSKPLMELRLCTEKRIKAGQTWTRDRVEISRSEFERRY